jgi:general L-amino acid transport system substrate-binding protein
MALAGSGCSAPENQRASSTMALIRNRGQLICGVEGTMPGFSWLSPSNREQGLDADLCRAVAAALLGDGERVRFIHLSAAERFTALGSGEVDLLARNTSISLSRDAAGGNAVSFGPIVYYDSQGLLVPMASGVRAAADLAGQPICVVTGTTTEQNLADWGRRNRVAITPLKFQTHDQSFSAYLKGRCTAVTSSRALLASRRSTFRNPQAHKLLKEELSQEPLAPATRQGDPGWADAVRWIVYALIRAEELGLSQANLRAEGAAAQRDPRRLEQRRFLGVGADLGRQLELPADFGARAVAAVGNYGELFERHMGPSSRLGLPRGRQRLVDDGGWIQAPPFR